MNEILTSLCLVFLLSGPPSVGGGVEVSLKNNSEREIQTKRQLERLIKEHGLSKWTFTRKVMIDEKERIPHSHPVLTLNTRYLNDDLRLVSIFVHEQLHWHEEKYPEQRDRAMEELKVIFPNAPAKPPAGARDKSSTYLHLIVCYLEYEAMKELAGADKAREIMGSWPYYTWVYQTVLSDGPKIKAVIEKHKLST